METSYHNSPLSSLLPLSGNFIGQILDPLMSLPFLFHFPSFYLFVLLFGRLPQLSVPIIFLFSEISFIPDHSIFTVFSPCVVHVKSCLISEAVLLYSIF